MSTDPDAARVLAALERSHTEALDVVLGIHFPEDAPHPRAGRVGHRPWAEVRREMLERRLTEWEAQARPGDAEIGLDEEGRFILTTVPIEDVRPGLQHSGDVEVWTSSDGLTHTFPAGLAVGGRAAQEAYELEQSAVDLARRTTMTTEEARDTLVRASRTTGALVRELWVHLSHTVEEYAEALAALFDGMSEGPARPEPPEDPRERALWARRNRNTGPQPGRYRYDGTRRNG